VSWGIVGCINGADSGAGRCSPPLRPVGFFWCSLAGGHLTVDFEPREALPLGAGHLPMGDDSTFRGVHFPGAGVLWGMTKTGEFFWQSTP